MARPPWNIEEVRISVTKHFALNYLRKWGWDASDLRDAIAQAYEIIRVGRLKYEVYIRKGGFKKIISIYYQGEKELLCISGSQGGKRI